MRRAAAARKHHDEIADQVARLQQEQDAHMCFEVSEGWRQDGIARLHAQLDHHWAAVVAACVRADDPLAYGIDKLRHARATLAEDRRPTEAGIPADRADQWRQARQQLPEVVRQRHQAEELLAAGQAGLQDAGRRRWGRQDHEAVADAQVRVAAGERRVQQAVAAERDLRELVGAFAEHQQRRQQHIADISAHRKELDAAVAQVDAALDRTRPSRVAALADDPPEHLVHRIGPAPDTPAGRAVSCHHPLDIEATLDREGGRIPVGRMEPTRTTPEGRERGAQDRPSGAILSLRAPGFGCRLCVSP